MLFMQKLCILFNFYYNYASKTAFYRIFYVYLYILCIKLCIIQFYPHLFPPLFIYIIVKKAKVFIANFDFFISPPPFFSKKSLRKGWEIVFCVFITRPKLFHLSGLKCYNFIVETNEEVILWHFYQNLKTHKR